MSGDFETRKALQIVTQMVENVFSIVPNILDICFEKKYISYEPEIVEQQVKFSENTLIVSVENEGADFLDQALQINGIPYIKVPSEPIIDASNGAIKAQGRYLYILRDIDQKKLVEKAIPKAQELFQKKLLKEEQDKLKELGLDDEIPVIELGEYPDDEEQEDEINNINDEDNINNEDDTNNIYDEGNQKSNPKDKKKKIKKIHELKEDYRNEYTLQESAQVEYENSKKIEQEYYDSVQPTVKELNEKIYSAENKYTEKEQEYKERSKEYEEAKTNYEQINSQYETNKEEINKNFENDKKERSQKITEYASVLEKQTVEANNKAEEARKQLEYEQRKIDHLRNKITSQGGSSDDFKALEIAESKLNKAQENFNKTSQNASDISKKYDYYKNNMDYQIKSEYKEAETLRDKKLEENTKRLNEAREHYKNTERAKNIIDADMTFIKAEINDNKNTLQSIYNEQNELRKSIQEVKDNKNTVDLASARNKSIYDLVNDKKTEFNILTQNINKGTYSGDELNSFTPQMQYTVNKRGISVIGTDEGLKDNKSFLTGIPTYTNISKYNQETSKLDVISSTPGLKTNTSVDITTKKNFQNSIMSYNDVNKIDVVKQQMFGIQTTNKVIQKGHAEQVIDVSGLNKLYRGATTKTIKKTENMIVQTVREAITHNSGEGGQTVEEFANYTYPIVSALGNNAHNMYVTALNTNKNGPEAVQRVVNGKVVTQLDFGRKLNDTQLKAMLKAMNPTLSDEEIVKMMTNMKGADALAVKIASGKLNYLSKEQRDKLLESSLKLSAKLQSLNNPQQLAARFKAIITESKQFGEIGTLIKFLEDNGVSDELKQVLLKTSKQQLLDPHTYSKLLLKFKGKADTEFLEKYMTTLSSTKRKGLTMSCIRQELFQLFRKGFNSAGGQMMFKCYDMSHRVYTTFRAAMKLVNFMTKHYMRLRNPNVTKGVIDIAKSNINAAKARAMQAAAHKFTSTALYQRASNTAFAHSMKALKKGVDKALNAVKTKIREMLLNNVVSKFFAQQLAKLAQSALAQQIGGAIAAAATPVLIAIAIILILIILWIAGSSIYTAYFQDASGGQTIGSQQSSSTSPTALTYNFADDTEIVEEIVTELSKKNKEFISEINNAANNRGAYVNTSGVTVNQDVGFYEQGAYKIIFRDAMTGKELEHNHVDLNNTKAIISMASQYIPYTFKKPSENASQAAKDEYQAMKQHFKDYCYLLWAATHQISIEEYTPGNGGENADDESGMTTTVDQGKCDKDGTTIWLPDDFTRNEIILYKQDEIEDADEDTVQQKQICKTCTDITTINGYNNIANGAESSDAICTHPSSNSEHDGWVKTGNWRWAINTRTGYKHKQCDNVNCSKDSTDNCSTFFCDEFPNYHANGATNTSLMTNEKDEDGNPIYQKIHYHNKDEYHKEYEWKYVCGGHLGAVVYVTIGDLSRLPSLGAAGDVDYENVGEYPEDIVSGGSYVYEDVSDYSFEYNGGGELSGMTMGGMPVEFYMLSISGETSGLYSVNAIMGDAGQAYGVCQFDFECDLMNFIRWAYNEDPDLWSGFQPYLGYKSGDSALIGNKGIQQAFIDAMKKDYQKALAMQLEKFRSLYWDECAAQLNAAGYNLNERNIAVSAAILSINVNCGKQTKRYLQYLDPNMTDEEMIDKLYWIRNNICSEDTFRRKGKIVRKGTNDRYRKWEPALAKKLLNGQLTVDSIDTTGAASGDEWHGNAFVGPITPIK